MIRIVKMTFRKDEVGSFESLFNIVRPKIEEQQGCNGVQLLRDLADRRIYFTYSTWDSDADLQAYRNSELFADTWAKTKALFDGKPEAWSVEQQED